MIQPRVEMIVVVASGRRRNKVLKRDVSIWRRIQRGDGSAYGADEQIRNRVLRKRLLRERIDRSAKETLGEVALALGKGRHVGDASDSLVHPRAFVVRKEERSVRYNGTAQRKTELVSLVLRSFFAGGRKEVARVQTSISKELVGGAVQGI